MFLECRNSYCLDLIFVIVFVLFCFRHAQVRVPPVEHMKQHGLHGTANSFRVPLNIGERNGDKS